MTEPTRQDLIQTMRRHKICVLVPTYNNAGTLADVLRGILNFAADVIVVNDGSTDSTAEILNTFDNEITVVSYPHNAGKGHALRQGFRKALSLGYDYAITLDSDGQHYPEDIPAFVRAIVENPDSLVVGERDLTGVDINGKSSFANKFSNFWFCVQTARRLRDTQTGYRAYPLHKLRGLRLLTSRYEAELELLVFAAWGGVRIVQIPIRVYYPPQSERVSHFRPALDFTRISVLNTVLCVAAVVYGLPARLLHALAQRKFFNREFRTFTRVGDAQRDEAATICRFIRSVYGFSVFAIMAMGIFTPFAIIYFSIGKNTEKKRLRFHRMLRRASRFITRGLPGAKTIVENPHHETFETPAVVVCNHQSHLDLPMLMSVSERLIFLTNDWVWNSKIFGKIIHNAEFLPVSSGMETIIPKLHDLVKRGYSIVIFPEGTRSADCRIMRFHQGAFYLARELGVDIVPMAIHGAGHFQPKKSLLFRRGQITLGIGRRVNLDELVDMPMMKQASFFRKTVRSIHNDIAERIENADYCRSQVFYRHVWRGWDITARGRRELRRSRRYDAIINGHNTGGKVRFLNSGNGVIPLLFALVNRDTEVFAYENDIYLHNIAANTAALPPNLHIIHAVWQSELGDDETFDKTIDLKEEQ